MASRVRLLTPTAISVRGLQWRGILQWWIKETGSGRQMTPIPATRIPQQTPSTYLWSEFGRKFIKLCSLPRPSSRKFVARRASVAVCYLS